MDRQTDDVRSTPPTGARLTGRAESDLRVDEPEGRPLPSAIAALEGSVQRLDAEVQGLVEELGQVLGGSGLDSVVEADVLPSGSSPLRDRVIVMRGNVEGIRNTIADLRARMEV